VIPLRFAVIGNPIAHSKSPSMHGAALRALGLPHTYEALLTQNDELPARVQALRDGVFAGLNVTVPHKARVLPLVDALDESALRTGAANTLVRTSDGRVVAHNTDAPALAAELSALSGHAAGAPAWGAAPALVLGSGGAARAAVQALAMLGVREVLVRARRSGLEGLATQPFQPDKTSEARTAVVIQATSAGMDGADPGERVATAVAWEALPASALVLDVVYAPAETPFLRAARRRGLRATGGLGMLSRQGALALSLWLGVPPPLDVMRAALA
jgi:shikimate dehydrogenase